MADMTCPKCGGQCGRDEVHNGVAMLYGPWGCACGWSEWEEYDLSAGQSSVCDGGKIDQWGGFTPAPALSQAKWSPSHD